MASTQEDDPNVPIDHNNLVWKVIVMLQERYGISNGAKVKIVKRIPIASGLAGGSSNAAAALLAFKKLWRIDIPLHEMLEIGAEIGMDVPFFLLGETALATDKGQRVQNVSSIPRLFVVLANPGFQVSTQEAYKDLEIERGNCCKTLSMLAALTRGDKNGILIYTMILKKP